MRHIWSVISEKATIDQDSNNLSLINIIEQLTISSSPEELAKVSSDEGIVVPFKLFFVSLWSKEEKELNKEVGLELQLKIIDPEGKELASIANESKVSENHKRMRTRFKLDGFKITGPGTYEVVISKKDGDKYKKVHSLPLDINLKTDINN